MTASNPSPAQIWERAVDLVKDRVNRRSLWVALEKAVGIAVADDTFIIGLNPRFLSEAGHLRTAEHQIAIERAVREVAGQPLKVRLIEGDSLADWRAAQEADRRIAAMRESTYERRDRQEAEAQSWDALYEYVGRAYSSVPLRTLPQSRARYLTSMLYVLADALDTLYPETPDEATERQLARVIERVASNCEASATIVALELERLRAWRAQNPAQP